MGEWRADIPPSLRRIVTRSLNKPARQTLSERARTGGCLAKCAARNRAFKGRRARQKERGIPLKVKLAMAMTAIVAVTMALTSVFVTQRQYQTMLSQTVNQGASLAKLIAVEHAHQALSEDWVSIDVSVQSMTKALDARGLSVVDIKNTVRVSTDPAQVGKPYQKLSGDPLAARDPSVSVLRLQDNGVSSFGFVVPILVPGARDRQSTTGATRRRARRSGTRKRLANGLAAAGNRRYGDTGHLPVARPLRTATALARGIAG